MMKSTRPVLGLGAALLIAACSSNKNSNGGMGGAGGDLDAAVDTGPHPCAGMAISFDSNVPLANGDPAKSRVMVDFGDGSHARRRARHHLHSFADRQQPAHD